MMEAVCVCMPGLVRVTQWETGNYTLIPIEFRMTILSRSLDLAKALKNYLTDRSLALFTYLDGYKNLAVEWVNFMSQKEAPTID